MGCQASKTTRTSGENRPDELAKCAVVSQDVRWSWLRGRSLFNFPELRSLYNIFTAAVTTPVPQQQQQQLQPPQPQPQQQLGKSPAPICSVEMSNNSINNNSSKSSKNKNSRSKRSSTTTKKKSKAGEEVQQLIMMDKAQFLSLCEDSSNDTLLFRLGEVVGAFGSRLFDVLDEDGDGLLAFETFALGLSKLLKV